MAAGLELPLLVWLAVFLANLLNFLTLNSLAKKIGSCFKQTVVDTGLAGGFNPCV